MATRTFLGGAVAIQDVWTVTAADTFAGSDTVTLTINGKDLTATLGTDTATTDVATIISEMVNGTDPSSSATTTGDHSFSATGDKVGEFVRITATVSGSVATLTADDYGVPFTLTTSESTAGDGTISESNATVATGPEFWDDADNWSGDTVPVDGDDIIFDRGATSLKYNLSTGIQPASITITQGFTGDIGLPQVNEDETQYPYDEYRGTYLTFANDTGTSSTSITIGEGAGTGSQRINLDLADCTSPTFNIRNSGERADNQVPTILLLADATDTVLNVQRGDVGMAFFGSETAHIATLRVGYITQQTDDSTVTLGSGVDIANAALTISGGEVQIDSATGSGTIDMYGGELTILSGAHVDVEVYQSTLIYRSTGTLGGTTCKIGNEGVLDFRQDNQGRTVTNLDIYAGSSVFDPLRTGTYSNGINLNGCQMEDVTIDLGTDWTLTPSEI